MSKIHFNNTFSSGCVQFMAADWPATTAHKMIYLLTSYTVQGLYLEICQMVMPPFLYAKKIENLHMLLT